MVFWMKTLSCFFLCGKPSFCGANFPCYDAREMHFPEIKFLAGLQSVYKRLTAQGMDGAAKRPGDERKLAKI